MDLDNLSTEQLEAELKRRAQPTGTPPEPLPNPDFTELIETVKSGLARSCQDRYQSDDL